MECLHTILLGPVKYFLTELMERLSQEAKNDIEANVNSMNWSGIRGRINGGSICRCIVICGYVNL